LQSISPQLTKHSDKSSVMKVTVQQNLIKVIMNKREKRADSNAFQTIINFSLRD